MGFGFSRRVSRTGFPVAELEARIPLALLRFVLDNDTVYRIFRLM